VLKEKSFTFISLFIRYLSLFVVIRRYPSMYVIFHQTEVSYIIYWTVWFFWCSPFVIYWKVWFLTAILGRTNLFRSFRVLSHIWHTFCYFLNFLRWYLEQMWANQRLQKLKLKQICCSHETRLNPGSFLVICLDFFLFSFLVFECFVMSCIILSPF